MGAMLKRRRQRLDGRFAPRAAALSRVREIDLGRLDVAFIHKSGAIQNGPCVTILRQKYAYFAWANHNNSPANLFMGTYGLAKKARTCRLSTVCGQDVGALEPLSGHHHFSDEDD